MRPGDCELPGGSEVSIVDGPWSPGIPVTLCLVFRHFEQDGEAAVDESHDDTQAVPFRPATEYNAPSA